jgi:multicomponent Na+:H+ antiporter subunit D
MRRLLSYHIISQVGYMVAGIGLYASLGAGSGVGTLGLVGGLAHMFNNLLYKTLLFMTVGVIIWKTGENLLSRVGGLQKRMPVTAFAFWIAAFSISGVPFFSGFVSKGMVMFAAEETSLVLWALLAIASFGTFLSFLKLGFFAFLRPAKAEIPGASDPPLPAQIAMVVIAVLCVAVGVYPPLLYAILPAPVIYAAFSPFRLAESLLILGATAAFFFTVGRRLLEPHDTRMRDADVIYVATGRGILSFAGSLQSAFRTVYHGATTAAMGFFHAGTLATGMEDRDVNWNSVAFGCALLAVLVLVLSGVGS